MNRLSRKTGMQRFSCGQQNSRPRASATAFRCRHRSVTPAPGRPMCISASSKACLLAAEVSCFRLAVSASSLVCACRLSNCECFVFLDSTSPTVCVSAEGSTAPQREVKCRRRAWKDKHRSEAQLTLVYIRPPVTGYQESKHCIKGCRA